MVRKHGAKTLTDTTDAAAYGGPGWSPRTASLQSELGKIWGACGANTEWSPLRSVLLHRPGTELKASSDPNTVQMLGSLDVARAGEQHDAIARAYEETNIVVRRVQPGAVPTPNMMFVADLLLMTPEGAILGRPASTVHAGEERWIARRLGDLGIPILRTNAEGAAQVTSTLVEMGIEVIQVGLPFGAMHLMGTLRFLDSDLAVARRGRVPYAAVEALHKRGYRVLFAPNHPEIERGSALNSVTLGPRRILMAAGNTISQEFFEKCGVVCHTVEVNELIKAAGGIGCLSGILQRDIKAHEAAMTDRTAGHRKTA